MKFRRLFKKAAAALMAAVTALSVLPATTAFAAGDIGTISFTHTYDSNGNAMRYNSSAVINGYTAGGTGNYKYRMYVDGDVAFCIQPGVPLKTGNTLKKNSSETWNALSASQKKAVGLALLYGYQGNRGNLSGSDDEKWLARKARNTVPYKPRLRDYMRNIQRYSACLIRRNLRSCGKSRRAAKSRKPIFPRPLRKRTLPTRQRARSARPSISSPRNEKNRKNRKERDK